MGIKAIDSVGPAGAKTVAQPDLALLSMPAVTDFREQPVNEVVPEGAAKNPTAPNSPSFNLREVKNPNLKRVSFEPPDSPSSLNLSSVAEKGSSKLLDFTDPDSSESKQELLKSAKGISFKLKSVAIDAYIKENYPASPRSKATPSESTLRLKADGAKAFSSKLGPSEFSASFSKKGMAPGPHGAGGKQYGDPGLTSAPVAAGRLLSRRGQGGQEQTVIDEFYGANPSVEGSESKSDGPPAEETPLYYVEKDVSAVKALLPAGAQVSNQDVKNLLLNSKVAPLEPGLPKPPAFFAEVLPK